MPALWDNSKVVEDKTANKVYDYDGQHITDEWLNAHYINDTYNQNQSECPECGHKGRLHSPDMGCLVEQWNEYCNCGRAPIEDFDEDYWPPARAQRDDL